MRTYLRDASMVLGVSGDASMVLGVSGDACLVVGDASRCSVVQLGAVAERGQRWYLLRATPRARTKGGGDRGMPGVPSKVSNEYAPIYAIPNPLCYDGAWAN